MGGEGWKALWDVVSKIAMVSVIGVWGFGVKMYSDAKDRDREMAVRDVRIQSMQDQIRTMRSDSTLREVALEVSQLSRSMARIETKVENIERRTQ